MMCKFNRCGVCFNCYSKHFNKDCFPCEDADPMTNADRIRALSDDELAMFLTDVADLDAEYCHEGLCKDDETCRICCLKWLQQPAEEDKHEQ